MQKKNKAGQRGETSRKAHKARPKRRRDAEHSRQLILNTALRHFASRGYDGARVDDIVAETHLSKNMLYHYYGSKEDLFVAVLEVMYERLRGQHGKVSMANLEPVEALKRLISETAKSLIRTPEIISILNAENLYKAVHIKTSRKIRMIYDPFFEDLNQILRKGREAGAFRSDIDALQLYISLSSLVYHYLSNGHTLSVVMRQNLLTKARIAERIRHVEEMILRFCIRPELAARYLR
ncbi:MAG: TetR family transcriptional regulator [Alphaproteobacteria bacterium]|nr:TetR family transcriptional regulator [Alphaproteobacteria bacterium]